MLTNAVKFTPEGSITLGLTLAGEENGICEIEIGVTDTGVGISQEQQKRLFKSFEQAESSTSRKFGGTGLGLAISRHIVELMDGAIKIESELGKGAAFICTVKLRRAPDLEAAATIDAGLRDVRILVVDDEPETLKYFTALSERFGVECDVAASGREALNLYGRSAVYDMCFIDWRMPGMDGIELSGLLRASGKDDPVIIMISAYDWIEVEQDAKKAGVNGFLSKPLFPSDVADCIKKYAGAANVSDETDGDDSQKISFEGRRILLAEDMELNREIVMALLEPTRVLIDCAANGEEALAMFTEAPDSYDMIFMDIQMPEMDGITATERIRALDFKKAKEIPIVAMTANVFKEDVEQCLAAGMNGHIGKPIDFDEIIGRMKAYL